MKELSESIAEAFRKRVTSATLGTYLFFWSAFHWEGIYTTLFTDQLLIYEKYGRLKNEYVNQYFFGWHGWPSLKLFILPLVLTILFVWPLPKFVLIHAYRQEQRHKADRRRVRFEEEEKIKAARKIAADQEFDTLQAEIQTSEKKRQAAAQDPHILWKSEYDAFVESGLIKYLDPIVTCIYEHGGRVTAYYDDRQENWVDTKVLKDEIAIAHTNDLINVNGDRISLTDKGKFFVSQSYMDKKLRL